MPINARKEGYSQTVVIVVDGNVQAVYARRVWQDKPANLVLDYSRAPATETLAWFEQAVLGCTLSEFLKSAKRVWPEQ